jgi:hypothetical protein
MAQQPESQNPTEQTFVLQLQVRLIPANSNADVTGYSNTGTVEVSGYRYEVYVSPIGSQGGAQGIAAQGIAAQGIAAQGIAAQGIAAQGIAAQGIAAQGISRQGIAAQGISRQGIAR